MSTYISQDRHIHSDQLDIFKIKEIPEDFRVSECAVLPIEYGDTNASCAYYKLTKKGITTFHAIDLIRNVLNIEFSEIGYGGLKDEDAITEQHISILKSSIGKSNPEISLELSKDAWLKVTKAGEGNTPIQIGRIEGNSFRLCLRGIKEIYLENKELFQESNGFINYYDIQRFGVPGGKRNTHLIGKAIIEEDWEKSFQEICVSGSEDGIKACTHRGSALSFFEKLNPNKVAFFCSAYGSHLWNENLSKALIEKFPESDLSTVCIEGVDFVYLNQPGNIKKMISELPHLPLDKYSNENGRIEKKTSNRPTVTPSRVRLISIDEDDIYSERRKATIAFFLPSGCYATAMIRQLAHYTVHQQIK
ncbi:tRNA pseudouridine(13) synthase TruD [Xanthomonas euvesicatoria]|uniref:tRNA pseudouridine(13) synthase TruD n=1 Tax=Xanthomonas euvesicatoria TaxID=456327 RepID=UPI001C495DAF|nr:tRNA pseudouridine(13) synthase TruD [Xanthomonas euvesicatoria]MBV6896576.1 tRNA pseudouridine(13) synthase TruD [Xanthomonas campestris pv. ionidii]